jgi:hypothetical protein
MGTRAAVVIGHLPDGLRPGRLGQLRAPAIERNLTVSSATRSRQVTIQLEPKSSPVATEMLEIADSARLKGHPGRAGSRAQIASF